MKKLFFIGILVGLWTIPGIVGAFTIISDPTAEYLAATHYIDFPYDAGAIDYITDGTETVSFSTTMYTAGAPGYGWATWSEAPYSQRLAGETLPVATTGDQWVLFSLSKPASIFGFEAEPNSFDDFDMTAYFYDTSAGYLGRIDRTVAGYYGARLFAASEIPIGYVYFGTDGASGGWAVGAFRYSTPEPSVLLLLGAGLIGLVGLRRKFWK
jgi:hypothetical protein